MEKGFEGKTYEELLKLLSLFSLEECSRASWGGSRGEVLISSFWSLVAGHEEME